MSHKQDLLAGIVLLVALALFLTACNSNDPAVQNLVRQVETHELAFTKVSYDPDAEADARSIGQAWSGVSSQVYGIAPGLPRLHVLTPYVIEVTDYYNGHPFTVITAAEEGHYNEP